MQALKHPVELLNVREARETTRPEHEGAHDALIREIAEDARISPESYLRDTIVPEGGE